MARVRFGRFWLTTLLPLALALPLLVDVAWKNRVTLPIDAGEGVVEQYGFPLPSAMPYCCSSATPEIFVLPLLLNWAFALAWVTGLGRWLWPQLTSQQRHLLHGVAWFSLALALPMTALAFAIARWHWVSPYAVLEWLGVRPHFFLW